MLQTDSITLLDVNFYDKVKLLFLGIFQHFIKVVFLYAPLSSVADKKKMIFDFSGIFYQKSLNKNPSKFNHKTSYTQSTNKAYQTTEKTIMNRRVVRKLDRKYANNK